MSWRVRIRLQRILGGPDVDLKVRRGQLKAGKRGRRRPPCVQRRWGIQVPQRRPHARRRNREGSQVGGVVSRKGDGLVQLGRRVRGRRMGQSGGQSVVVPNSPESTARQGTRDDVWRIQEGRADRARAIALEIKVWRQIDTDFVD